MRTALATLLVLMASATQLAGQSTYASITGTVTDASGASASGAAVTLTNPATNVSRTATTNETGSYNFPSVLPGIYSVKVELQGFQTEVRSGIELQVQQAARIDFKLSVGAMTQTVEVTGGAP